MSKEMNIVVVGAAACGAKAAARVRRLNPSAKITMLDEGEYISVAGCGLPYFVEGKIGEIDDLLKTAYGRVRDADFFKEAKNIDVRIKTRVESIDRESKCVRARDLDSDETLSFPYDKLVLAMGAAASKPPIEGLDLKGVHCLKTIEDAAAVAEKVKAVPGGSAVIIGAGFIGVEACEALATKGWEVTLLERFDQVFPGVLDSEIAALVQEQMFEQMVDVQLEAEVLRIEGEDGAVSKVVTKTDEFEADLVILAAGVRPNIALAQEAGLEIGATGALAVNSLLQTSDPEIYAGGDLVENSDIVSGAKRYTPLGSTANKHGRVIGDNICGIETKFPGICGTFICKAFSIYVGATGMTEKAAEAAGLNVDYVLASGMNIAHYYPGAQIIGIKMVVEKSSGRLMGMQAIGFGDVARRIDVAATAMTFGATIDQVADLDLSYAPPVAQAMDCLINAANAARNVRSGMLKGVKPAQLRRQLLEDDNVLALDVRSEMEFKRMRLPGDKVVNIPLDDLPARLGELPRDKTILTVCSVGLRSFSAQVILDAAGFENVGILEGGLFLWPWKDELE